MFDLGGRYRGFLRGLTSELVVILVVEIDLAWPL